LNCLSNEEIEKLEKTKPETIHQASRIPGITPTCLFAILSKLKI
jgi:tRNA U34 5-carboxymethylaminomethyl modifying enzyme MnmG/GidA